MKRTLAAKLQPIFPKRRLIARRGSRTGAVALTFDDGPHPQGTPRILEALKAEGVRATFFVLGREVERYPELVRAIADGGHALGNHGFSHSHPKRLSAVALGEEIDRTAESLKQAGVETVRLFRPAYGELSLSVVRCAFKRSLTIAMWSLDSRDSIDNPDAETIRERVHCAQAGDILLFHDDSENTPEALRGVIQDLKACGLSFATVPEWVGMTS